MEKSCGAVIYKYKNNELYFLILKHLKGHYSFSKGHVENNETEYETAEREIKEETNLNIEFINGFRKTSIYSPKENNLKEVVLFLAKDKGNSILKPQLDEISEISWYKENDALNILTYEEDKNILKDAILFLRKRNI